MMHADRTNKARKANTMTKASRSTQNPSRRRFLEFVAASPLLAAGAGPALAELIQKAEDLPADKMWLDLVEGLIASPDEAVNIFDFEAVTKVRLPPAHFGFLASGVGGEETLRANRVAFEDYVLKPRRLIDVSQPDLSTTVLGETFSSPVGLAPLGSQLVFHREAEAATARAAATGNHLQILSTQTNTELARVNEARGKPVWFQLYASDSRIWRGRGSATQKRPVARFWSSRSIWLANGCWRPRTCCGAPTRATARCATVRQPWTSVCGSCPCIGISI